MLTKSAKEAAAATLVAVLAGCMGIRDARVAQDAVLDRATGEIVENDEEPEFGETLESHVSYAIEHRPAMENAGLEVLDARLRLKEIASDAPVLSETPWGAFTVNGNLGHSEQSKSAHFDKMKKKTDGVASGGISFDVLLWDFGRNSANAKAQAERVVAAEMEAQKTAYTIFEDVANAYFARLESAALLEVALTNAHMRSEHLLQAEERLKAGEAQKLDVLRARLDFTEAQEQIVSVSNDYATAGARLANAMGLDATWGDDIPFGKGSFRDSVRVFEDSSDSADELFLFARTNSPSMQVARARLRAASSAVDYAISDLMPSVSASLSLNWTDPLWYWRWGVNGVQNLFSGFGKVTALERAVVAMDVAATAVDEAELALSLEIALAVVERDNAREAYITAEATVQSARENLETVSAQLMVGDASRVEYTDAVADYVSALANRVKAFYRGQSAEAKLFSLAGVSPVYFEESKEGDGE